MTIWKFKIEIVDSQEIPMPTGAQVLTVQMQGGTPFIWAICDPLAPMKDRGFALYGTGHHVQDMDLPYLRYVGTFQMEGGSLVFHLFESLA